MGSQIKFLIHSLICPDDVYREVETVRFSATVDKTVNRQLEYFAKRFNVSKTRLAGDALEAFISDLITEMKEQLSKDPEYIGAVCQEGPINQEEIIAEMEREELRNE